MAKNQQLKRAPSAPDWGGDDGGGAEISATAPGATEGAAPESPASTAPAATDSSLAEDAKVLLEATKDDADEQAGDGMHPGWSGGNVGEVTRAPQPEVSHPDEEGLPEPVLPEAPPVIVDERFVLPDPLPTDAHEAYKLLHKLNDIVVTTDVEFKKKREILHIFGQHYHKLQQGSPTEPIGSVEYGMSAVKHNQILNRQRIESLAVENPIVKELLADYDKLADQYNVLRQQNIDLQNKLNTPPK